MSRRSPPSATGSRGVPASRSRPRTASGSWRPASPTAGHGQVPKVCKLARQLGFRVIAALDFDEPGAGADLSFATAKDTADEVVRLPQGFAIEMALVHGIPLEVLREVMTELNGTWQLNLQGLETADDRKLRSPP